MSNKPIKAKARRGVVTMLLEDMTGVKPPKRFRLNSQQVTSIPLDYANYFLNSEGIKSLIRKGSIIILEGEEQLVENAKEEGLLDPEVKGLDKIDLEEVKEILLGTNLTKVKDLFSVEDPAKAQIAIEIARENVSEMKSGVIREVEKLTSTSIQNPED